ncbi:nuclear transport factor 2 family protein [Sinorhizobium meliloti]|uniref:nuclear transport factor 2 family protein n=1 Tax=Rhizobium meliloti TaxID=382 RepID=UPI000FDB4953|nr:nuclear transport factor 2 family protein [Sinorhizobium meliloti]RVG00692.1 nuclear transport factor 2 family protein [Sinorhizobium meliloti]RVH46767.1 nuclear transport factor 2 family protein [Sinorhizobium meliloti]RVK16873.1 nuclear transport factor 2 family protein [Sinorhizobium meliloti]
MLRSTSEVFDSHLNLRINGDLERDLVENYSEDVVLLTLNSNMSGHEAIRASAARLAEQLPGARFEFMAKQVSGPYALLIWRATSQRYDAVEGADSFVIEAGKIVFQSIHYKLVAG